jgi:hypothetical protein
LAIFPRLSEYGIARQFPPDPLLRSQKPEVPKAIPRSLLSTEVIFSCEPVPPQPSQSVALSRLRLCEGFHPTVLLHYFRSRLLVGSDAEVYEVPILGEERRLYLTDEISSDANSLVLFIVHLFLTPLRVEQLIESEAIK